MKSMGLEQHIYADIDLEATLLCGQTFAWNKKDGGYIACIEGNPIYVKPAGKRGFALVSEREDADYWHKYFDIGRDYAAVFSRHLQDQYVQRAYMEYGGLRVLNQPVWETVCAFILSANNNVKRIRGIIERLSIKYGARRDFLGQRIYAFPSPESLAQASIEDLRELGLGYRAPYISASAQMVAQGGISLDTLCEIGYENAVKDLLKLKGVGQKVADCILLFSCGYQSAFPVDTWVLRVMRALYKLEGNAANIRRAGMQLFGEDAGIVQQALFHAARMGIYPELSKTRT